MGKEESIYLVISLLFAVEVSYATRRLLSPEICL